MAKKNRSSVLNRFAGKSVFFSGKFDYGVKETLTSMAQANQATILGDLTAKTDYLVLSDSNSGKTIQKKADSFNRKGATIQVLDAAAFRSLATPTQEEWLAILQDGRRGAETLGAIAPSNRYFRHGVPPDSPRLVGMKLDGLDLTGFRFSSIAFENCSFVGAILHDMNIDEAIDCDFSKAVGKDAQFGKIDRSRFVKADLSECHFEGHLAGCDFTSAKLEKCKFSRHSWNIQHVPPPSKQGAQFTKAQLHGCIFEGMPLEDANFDDADLTDAAFMACSLEKASFRNAKARDAHFVAAGLSKVDFTNAALTGANLAEADLTGATWSGADLTGANLRGAKYLSNALQKAKGVASAITTAASAGPALAELDTIFDQARTVSIAIQLDGNTEDEIQLDFRTYSDGKTHFSQFYSSMPIEKIASHTLGRKRFSDAMVQAGRVFGNYPVRFETVEVSSTKSPKSKKELHDLVLQGIAEAFLQELPAADVLAEATKKFRDEKREAGAAQRERREKAKAEADKQKEKAKKQIAKKIEKAVGKVTDIATFLKALELRIEKPKIDKATKMLKASGFKLFNDVTDQWVSGVVKSQTDPDLVYACRLDHEGHYSCCTQNLNICGGLRGSICKHLLVLIVGLVQAGELDPTTIDAWIAKTHNIKSELDKENMGAIFLKFKGAEAGEVDWRPTETVPEDYYAF